MHIYVPDRVKAYSAMLRKVQKIPGDVADAIAFGVDMLVQAGRSKGPGTGDEFRLGRVIERDPAMRYLWECGCFPRHRLEDLPIWIGGNRGVVAAGFSSTVLDVAPAEPAIMYKFQLQSAFNIAGKQQSAGPALGITTLERSGNRTLLKRANEITTPQLPGVVADPTNATQGLPTGPMPVSSTEPFFYEFTNNAGEGVEHNAGGLGWLVDWDAYQRALGQGIVLEAWWKYWLSAQFQSLATGAGATFRMYGGEDGMVRTFIASSASVLTSAGGLFTLDGRWGLNITSIEQARVDTVSAATAGEGVPGSEASYPKGQLLVRPGTPAMHISSSAANALDIVIENRNPGTQVVQVAAEFWPDMYREVRKAA